MEPSAVEYPWESLSAMITAGDAAGVRTLLAGLGPFEMARAISRLTSDDQTRLLELIGPGDAAAVLSEVHDAQAADLIEQLPAKNAAAILDEIRSDDQADLLAQLPDSDAQAILDEMSPDEASDAIRLLQYPDDTAGGLMVTEYLAYPGSRTIGEVIADLERKRKSYADYSIQYLYVIGDSAKLEGVLRLRDLIFSATGAVLKDVMIREPMAISANASLDEVGQFFDRYRFVGAPVVDDEGRLVGVVRRSAVEEADSERAVRHFLGVSGIIRGEEFRSMPLWSRSGRRLSWLMINIVLNIVAASVIALYTDTLAAVIALAVFLPMISDMSGCSGSQAVAVSMRELTLGLVRPTELLRVIGKEISVGLINGVVLGAALAAVALLWKGSPYLGLVVGVALAANTVVAVCLGGALPLVLRRLKLDPALVSGPVLTTVTDMCGFFIVLSLATALLPKLVGK